MDDVILTALIVIVALSAAGFGLIGSRILFVKRASRRTRHRRRR